MKLGTRSTSFRTQSMELFSPSISFRRTFSSVGPPRDTKKGRRRRAPQVRGSYPRGLGLVIRDRGSRGLTKTGRHFRIVRDLLVLADLMEDLAKLAVFGLPAPRHLASPRSRMSFGRLLGHAQVLTRTRNMVKVVTAIVADAHRHAGTLGKAGRGGSATKARVGQNLIVIVCLQK